MSRPSKAINRKKQIHLRVTLLEKKWIERTAAETGLTVSDFLRKSAFNKEVRVRFSEDEIALFKTLQQYHTNFKRIGNIIRKNKGEINQTLIEEINQVTNDVKSLIKRFEQ